MEKADFPCWKANRRGCLSGNSATTGSEASRAEAMQPRQREGFRQETAMALSTGVSDLFVSASRRPALVRFADPAVRQSAGRLAGLQRQARRVASCLGSAARCGRSACGSAMKRPELQLLLDGEEELQCQAATTSIRQHVAIAHRHRLVSTLQLRIDIGSLSRCHF